MSFLFGVNWGSVKIRPAYNLFCIKEMRKAVKEEFRNAHLLADGRMVDIPRRF